MPSAYQIRDAKVSSWRSVSALENLKINDNVTKPTSLAPNTVLVRIRAAALNARDLMVIAHDPVYPISTDDGVTPCSDGAGEIEAVGNGSKWKVGERVLVHCNAWTEGTDVPDMQNLRPKGGINVEGTLRQYAVLNDAEVIRGPRNLSLEEMAALPTGGGSAANALFWGPTPVGPGMTVLTQGTGGVSIFAIQLAAAVGATVIATSSSDSKLEAAKSLGATHLINYSTEPNWADKVLQLTNGKGVDHVVEVGGAGTIEQSLKATKQGGVVSVLGILSEEKPVSVVPALLFGGKTARGCFGVSKAMHEKLVEVVEKHNIRPAVAKTFDWQDTKAAFEALIKQSEVGKIVIRV